MTIKPRAPMGWVKETVEERNRAYAKRMMQEHMANIEAIDNGGPYKRFFNASTPEAARAYSEKQVSYWTAYLMLGRSPHQRDET